MKRKEKNGIVREIMLILSVITLFLLAACMKKSTMFSSHVVLFLATAAAAFFLLFFWVKEISMLILASGGRGFWRFVNKEKGMLATLFFVFFSRAIQFGDMPRWDSLIYYKALMDACRSFDFSFDSFMRFALASHPSLGYAGLTAIGEFLNEGGYTGVLVIWMFVTLCSAGCLYRIIEKVVPDRSWKYYMIAACMIMSTPLFLGTFSYYYPDAGTVPFFLFIAYCYLYKKNILLLFSMILLTQSKEIGAVILAGFGLGLFLSRIFAIKRKRGVKKIKEFFLEPVAISGIMSACFLILYFVLFLHSDRKIWSYGHGNWYSGFALRYSFILSKMKQFFVLNFNWFVWGWNAIAAALLIRKNKKKKPINLRERDLILSLVTVMLSLIIFYSVYITYTIPRYQVLLDFLNVMLAVLLTGALLPEPEEKYSTSNCKMKKVVQQSILVILGLLFFAEAYTMIDPLSKAVFGKGELNGHTTFRMDADGIIHNHQFNYLDTAYDQILRDVNFHEGMEIITYNGPIYSCLVHDGEYYWDAVEKKRVLVPNRNTFQISGVMQDWLRSGQVLESGLKKEALYISPEQYGLDEAYEEEFLLQYHYRICYKGFVEIPYGGRVRYIVCDHI